MAAAAASDAGSSLDAEQPWGGSYVGEGEGLPAARRLFAVPQRFLPYVLLDYVFCRLLPLCIWLPFQINEFFRRRNLRKMLSFISPSSVAPPPSTAIPGVTRHHLSSHLQYYVIDECPSPRRLVLFYAWLTARPRHVRKFVRLLTDAGLDVLVVNTFPWDAVSPHTCSQVIGGEVVQFLEEHRETYEQYAVFCCSAGAYVFTETVFRIYARPSLRAHVVPRFRAQLFDSAVDVRSIPVSIAVMLTRRPALQRCVTAYMAWFLRVRYATLTRFYHRATEIFYTGLLPCDAFYVYSGGDPMCPASVTEEIADQWRQNGRKLTRLVFTEGSGHCLNYVSHPEEYRRAVYSFLAGVGLLGPRAARLLGPN